MTKRFLLLVLAAAFALQAAAYETPVHRLITQKAWQEAGVYLEGRMGIKYNVTIGSPGMLPADWLAYGAVREDDILITDSYPPARSLNHFLDPQHNGAALTIGAPLCVNTAIIGGVPVPMEPADEWALRYPGNNLWSLYEVREHQYAALTALKPEERRQHGADMLRGVGQLVHLVQDMAQPEHTRNDQHLYPFDAVAPSLYEQWTLENLVTRPRPDSLNFFYRFQPVDLPRFGDYFRSGNGKGLADFASRNFVTQDTNYDDTGVDHCFTYSTPSILSTTSRTEYTGVPVMQPYGHTQIVGVLETVYESYPYDPQENITETDSYHTTLSIFDAEVQRYDPTQNVYSLNDQSYFSRALMLVPRAVSYSSGFMRKFFGGQISVLWHPQTKAADLYSVQIINHSGRTISQNAELTLTYRPGAAYLGRTDTQDSMVVLRGHLYDFGIGDIPPNGYSRTVPNVYPTFILPGDIVTEFERTAVLRENRATPDELITSVVDAAGKSSNLEFEISWPRDIPAQQRPKLVVTTWDGPPYSQGRYYIVADTGLNSVEIPTSILTQTPTGWKLHIQSTMPGWSHTFHLLTPQEATVQVRGVKNGAEVLNQTRTIPQNLQLLGTMLWEVAAEY